MESIPPPHVVMVPMSAPGHAMPFVHFAKQLAACGITITYVSSDKHISHLREALGTLDYTREGLQLRFLGLRDSEEELPTSGSPQEKIIDLFNPIPFLVSRDFAPGCYPSERPEKIVAIKLLEELVIDVGSSESQKLRGVAPAGPPMCILHDIFTTWAQVVADKLHIEKHLLCVSPVHYLAGNLQSERLAQEGRLPITSREARDTAISDIPGLQPCHPSDLSGAFCNPTIYNWMKYHHYRLGRANVILVNSFYELESGMRSLARAT
ncbi:hypothetical protein M758_1G143900 [Ceratodon purpureus]|nr:hypothetical protein M758_1G143900 [Ceratodon purpureus]